MGSFSIWHWLIVLLVVVLLFGTKKLRNVGGDLGSAIKSFRKGLNDTDRAEPATRAPASRGSRGARQPRERGDKLPRCSTAADRAGGDPLVASSCSCPRLPRAARTVGLSCARLVRACIRWCPTSSASLPRRLRQLQAHRRRIRSHRLDALKMISTQAHAPQRRPRLSSCPSSPTRSSSPRRLPTRRRMQRPHRLHGTAPANPNRGPMNYSADDTRAELLSHRSNGRSLLRAVSR